MTNAAPDRRPLPTADTPADEVIARELAPGEQLVWAGRPPQGVCLRLLHDVPPTLIVLVFALAGIGTLVRGAGLAGGGPNPVGGTLTLVFAAAYLGDRFVLAPRRRRLTWYGLTSERVVVVIRRRRTVRKASVVLAQVGEVHFTEWPNGGGLLGFDTPPWSELSAGDPWVTGRPDGATVLELPPGAAAVFALICDVRRANLVRAGSAEG